MNKKTLKINMNRKKSIKENKKTRSPKRLNTGWGNWDRHLNVFNDQENLQIMEVGVFQGVATSWFLDNLIMGDQARVVAIDTFEGSPEYDKDLKFTTVEETFYHNIKKTGKDKKVTVMKMKSQKALIKLNAHEENINRFDLIYIDASHEGADVILDAVLCWSLLKTGGIVIFDDYIWTKLHKPYFTPKPAIDSFLYLYKPQIKVIHIARQVFIQKIPFEQFEKPFLSISGINDNFNQYSYQSLLKVFNLRNYSQVKKKINSLELSLQSLENNPQLDLFDFLHTDLQNIETKPLLFQKYVQKMKGLKKVIKFLEQYNINLYFTTYEQLSLIKYPKKCNILSTTYTQINNPSKRQLLKLSSLSGTSLNKLVYLRSKNIGGPRDLGQTETTFLTDGTQIIKSFLYSRRNIEYLQKQLNTKFEIIRLIPFCIYKMQRKNYLKYCLKTMYANLILGFNFQQIGGSLMLCYGRIQNINQNLLRLLSCGLQFYENVKFIYSPVDIRRYHIVFEKFRGISELELKNFNIQLDNLKMVDFDSKYFSVSDFEKESAYQDFEFPEIKINNRLYPMLANFNHYVDTKVNKYIEFINTYNQVYKSYLEGYENDRKKLKSVIEYHQLETYIRWCLQKFRIS